MISTVRFAVLLLASLALAACAGHGNANLEEPPPSENWQVSMHRSGCFGHCPSYMVTVTGDGMVRFVGERYVAVDGEQTATAAPEPLARLQQRVQGPQIDGLLDSYAISDRSCGVWAADFPTITLDLSVDGRERHIRHYLGCEKAPQALRDLETAVDAAADILRWTQGPKS